MALALLVDAAPATGGTGKTPPATGGGKGPGTGTGTDTNKSGGGKGPTGDKIATPDGPGTGQQFLGYRTATAAEAADFNNKKFSNNIYDNFKSKVDGKANLGLAMYVVDNLKLLQVGKNDKLCYVYLITNLAAKEMDHEGSGSMKPVQFTQPKYKGKPVIADYDPKTASALEKNRWQAVEETYKRVHPNTIEYKIYPKDGVYQFSRISKRTSGSITGNQLAIPWGTVRESADVYCYEQNDPKAPKVSKLDYADLIKKGTWKPLVITDPPTK
ncbi:hypothetical protein D9758_016693 [Tetrapyrgos nigripes]|uniref:Uncharacterized protein n=1 Tax=Tetrapyrgos nigripes TaxID=182062 RepID=A0A8H5C606_9AGAR|nr:hypothetical protein D9758_016693 [Tetrapyrgos nigripes]